MLDWLRRSRARKEAAAALYAAIVRQARSPAFYGPFGVADTLDGRFDLLALHAFLALRRLKRQGAAAEAVAQAVLDLLFADMDRSLRELGVSDYSIGRKVKDTAKAFYGRAAAYDRALAQPGELEAALWRNVYRGAAERREAAGRLAAYARRALAHLETQPLPAILAGNVSFPAAEER